MAAWDDVGLGMWVTEARKARGGGGTAFDPESLAPRLRAMSFPEPYDPPPLRDPPPGVMALDFETYDPEITKRGPSWAFPGVGNILGIAVAWEGFDAYYSIGHTAGNTEFRVHDWLLAQCAREDLKFVCANAVYDLGWLRREFGRYPAGGVSDVQHMAALLDENRFTYALDAIAKLYLGVGKEKTVIAQIAKELGVGENVIMGLLRHLPANAVARYAAIDARRTYDLYFRMLPEIARQGLMRVFDLESKLLPMSTEMRRVGIRVDVARAEWTRDDIRDRRIPELQAEIKRETGVQVEPWEAATCEAALATIGYTCQRTRTGKPQIDVAALTDVARRHPLGNQILALRKMSKVQTTFLEGHILYYQNNGRVHTEFQQLRSEREEGGGYGTVTGRFSASNPGLQQIPARDPEWGPLVRSLFLPEEGEILASLDYSSQEPRLAVHFAYQAKLPGAAEAVAEFQRNPRTDYHKFVAELCGIPRGQAKTINLGCFGADTRVVTNNGVKRIVDVQLTDKLWDGVEWVTHGGTIYQGQKATIQLAGGLLVTPDHLVLCGKTWRPAQHLAQDENFLRHALETARGNSPSPGFLSAAVAALRTFWSSALVAARNTGCCGITLQPAKCHIAPRAGHGLRLAVETQGPTPCWPTRRIARDCSTGSTLLLVAAPTPPMPHGIITGGAAFRFMRRGWTIISSFWNTSLRWKVGTTRSGNWTESTTMVTTLPATSDSSHKPKILKTSVRDVFDVGNAGPRQRFTIVTSMGPLIVHNCSYGMGGAKLAHDLNLPTEWRLVERKNGRTVWTPLVGEEIDEAIAAGADVREVAGAETQAILAKWEAHAPFIRGLYRETERVAKTRGFILTLLRRRCRFPSDGGGGFDWTHKAMNRLCQSSAADQTKSGMLLLWEAGVTPLLTVHDELVFSVPNKEAAEAFVPYMVGATPLAVPSIVDVKVGETWGHIEK